MKDPDAAYTPSEQEAIGEAFRAWLPAPPTNEPAAEHARKVKQAQERAEAALRRADLASRRGDLAEAKRWGDVAAKLSESARQLAQAPPQLSEEEEEGQRAELLARIKRLAESDHELQRWEMRREIWEEMAAEAQRTGAPMPPPLPPRPAHWTDALPDDLRQKLDAECNAKGAR